jgi:hypothetical protein
MQASSKRREKPIGTDQVFRVGRSTASPGDPKLNPDADLADDTKGSGRPGDPGLTRL